MHNIMSIVCSGGDIHNLVPFVSDLIYVSMTYILSAEKKCNI